MEEHVGYVGYDGSGRPKYVIILYDTDEDVLSDEVLDALADLLEVEEFDESNFKIVEVH